ncbi:MAG: ArsR/SmtB family transcription factor [Nitrospinota bacterium]
MANYKINSLDHLVTVAKALADESRVRMLLSLRGGELCVCQIIEICGLAPSTVSKHMSILKQAGLVEGRKSGRWIYYRLAGEDAPAMVREALDWVQSSLARDQTIAEDGRYLKAILKIDREVLCRQQRGSSNSSSCAPATLAAARWRRAGPGA